MNKFSANVSIIIPCYNVEDYIEECVISCFNQTIPGIPIICVDNNSTDNTLAVLKQLKSKYGIQLYSESNKGACAARNKGLQYVTSKYVQFLDADDLLLPTKISSQVNYLEKENADFIVSNYLYKTVNGENIKQEVNKDIFKGLFTTTLGITSANLFKTAEIQRIAGWNENLSSSQEYNLMFRLLKNNCTPFICDQFETIVRERKEGAITQSDPVKKWENYIKLRGEIILWLKESQPSYLSSKSMFYSNKMFEYIQTLYYYDKSESLKTWEFYKLIFKIQPSSRIKKTLLKLIGFGNYCHIIKILKK